MFEHEQLLVQHKEACVMGWRRRSGNLIALRAEEARGETRQTSAAGRAPHWVGPGRARSGSHRDRRVRKCLVFMTATQGQT